MTEPSLRIAIAGALGGGINATLCYAAWPIAAGDHTSFRWHVVPAGAVHGAILVLVAMLAARLLKRRTALVRTICAPVVGWVAGAVSWVPLNRSAFEESWLQSLLWPFRGGLASVALAPLQYFGFVAAFYYLYIVFGRPSDRTLPQHLVASILCGVLGSLWWWTAVEPWYLSPLHGSIWGTLVGIAAWLNSAEVRRVVEGVA